MTDIQVQISDNNASIDVNFAQSIASVMTEHNVNASSHANIVTDFNTKLVAKADVSDIPTKVSQLQNDSNFATVSQLPTVPSNVSAFTNDANYATTSQLSTKADTVLSNITQATALVNLGFSGKSLATNGYYRLPGGLVLQWGQAAFVSGVKAVTYPVAFSNATLHVNNIIAGTSYSTESQVSNISTTGVTFYNNSPYTYSFYWFAIGY